MTDNNTDKETGSEGKTQTTKELVSFKTSEAQIKAEQAMVLAKKGEVNAFYAVALCLESMNDALKDVDGKPPRWVRIGRVGGVNPGEGWNKRPVGKMVGELTGLFLETLGIVAELTLKAKDLLTDIDGASALVEVGAEMLETLSDDQVVKSMAYSVGARKYEDDFNEDGSPRTSTTSFSNPLAPVGKGVRAAKTVLRYIPKPEDIEGVAKALYKLLNIEQLGKKDIRQQEGYEEHINWEQTGKARLISWTRQKPIPVFYGTGMSDFQNKVDVKSLGSRILPSDTAKAATKVRLLYKTQDYEWEVYKKNDQETAGDDCEEVDKILEKLGYEKDTLSLFQTNNKLPEPHGTLDIRTIHRLLNLDYDGKTLVRAEGNNV